ncbi:hypothetical protein BC628DRAFT_1119836 [Trametes gibbosa]|nr:hypothetical protein BC628DRAFT_1119836 [Trametes gibbosa]
MYEAVGQSGLAALCHGQMMAFFHSGCEGTHVFVRRGASPSVHVAFISRVRGGEEGGVQDKANACLATRRCWRAMMISTLQGNLARAFVRTLKLQGHGPGGVAQVLELELSWARMNQKVSASTEKKSRRKDIMGFLTHNPYRASPKDNRTSWTIKRSTL